MRQPPGAPSAACDAAAPEDLHGLVAAHLRGDQAATDVLIRRACDVSLRTAVLATGDHVMAGDISQETAIRVLNGLGKLRHPERFDGWVHRITVSETRRAWRKDRSHATLDPDVHEGDEQITAVIQRLSTATVVGGALAGLPQRQRTALALRYVHDLPDEQIAKAMRCRTGTVSSLISRAHAQLRQSTQLQDLHASHEGPS